MSIATRIESIEGHISDAYQGLQGLGADLTGIDKNIDNIASVLDDIYDSMPQVSGEGTSLTLDDTRVGKIKSTLKGNTSQTGTPTPTSPIPINVVSGDNEINVVGKNLVSFANFTNISGTSSFGVTRTFNGETIILNGTTTGEGSIITKSSTGIILKAGTYTGSITTSGSYNRPSGDAAFYLRKKNTISGMFNKSLEQMPTDGQYSSTFTLTEDTEVFLDIFANASNITFNNYTCKFQIEKGSSASTYEPYQGNTYNIDLPVENLFNYSYSNLKNINRCTTSQVDNGFTLTSTGVSGFAYASLEIDTTLLGKEITISMKSSGKNPSGRLFYHNSSGVLTSAVDDFWTTNNSYTTTLPSTLPSDITGIALVLYISQINNTSGEYATFSDIQIEAGSKANSYTPYGTTPIELCSSQDGTKRDYFYKDSGKWYIYKAIGKVVYDGTETGSSHYWYVQDENNYSYQITDNTIHIKESNSGLCNYFQIKTSGTTPYLYPILQAGTAYLRFVTYNTTGSTGTLADWKTWLSQNNVIYYYVLATPTTTEITDTELINQLDALASARSYTGQTNISQVNNDLPFIISASALKEWQENTSLNSTLSMVNPLSLGNTLNTQEIENNTQPIEVDNIEPLEEEENEES